HYPITPDQRTARAMLGPTGRVAEGITGVANFPSTLGLLWLATTTGSNAPDTASAQSLAAFLLHRNPLVGAAFFAVGSTIFCWLLLRGRMIPRWLAWVGFVGSALAAAVLPLEVAG